MHRPLEIRQCGKGGRLGERGGIGAGVKWSVDSGGRNGGRSGSGKLLRIASATAIVNQAGFIASLHLTAALPAATPVEAHDHVDIVLESTGHFTNADAARILRRHEVGRAALRGATPAPAPPSARLPVTKGSKHAA